MFNKYTLQPKPFSREGGDVSQNLEKWIISMEDYFQLVGYNDVAKMILATTKSEG